MSSHYTSGTAILLGFSKKLPNSIYVTYKVPRGYGSVARTKLKASNM